MKDAAECLDLLIKTHPPDPGLAHGPDCPYLPGHHGCAVRLLAARYRAERATAARLRGEREELRELARGYRDEAVRLAKLFEELPVLEPAAAGG